MSERIEPQNYTISVDEFKNSPDGILPYDVTSTFNRNNFLSVIIRSFYVSRGNPSNQNVYFGWLQANTGFNAHEARNNFLEAGGWDCFTDEEKGIFLEAFKRVKVHHDRDEIMIGMDEDPSSEIRTQLEDPNNFPEYAEDVESFIQKYGSLSRISERQLITFFKPNDSKSEE
jgi:hypothetical protein